MKYDAHKATITLDGKISDWANVEFKSQIPFAIGDRTANNIVIFEEWSGGTWSGPADHSSKFAFVWNTSNLYLRIVVTDDTHENSAKSFWNGDSLQLVFANASQDTVTHLYNYALSDDGDVIINNEDGPGGTECSITRNDETTTTLYELKFPAASLDLDAFKSGMQFGIGICINDSDTLEPGQRGWGGWGPNSRVFGLSPQDTGLVTLIGEASEQETKPDTKP